MERPSKHELTSWASVAGKPPQTRRTVDKEKYEAPNEKRDINGPMEEERTNKEIHEQVASTHYSETTTEQHHDTGRASTNRQGKINASHESTGLIKQNAKDRTEFSDEDMEETTSSRANKDDIQKTADEKHDRTMRLENQISGTDEEDAYTIILENAHEQARQLATTEKSHISPIRFKKKN